MNNSTSMALLVLCMAASVVACTHPAVAITSRSMDSRDTNAYNQYLKDAAQINIEREKAGLLPTKILNREEWSGKKQ